MESSKFHVLKVLDESTTDLEHDPINIKKWSSVACDLIHIFGEWKLKDLTCKNINTEMKKQIDHLHVGEKMDILMKIEIPNNISKAFSILEKYGKILQLPSITYIHVLVIRLNKEIQLLKDVPDLDNVVEWKNFISIMNKNTIMTSTPISSPMSQFSTTRKLLPLASPSSISCISDGLNESLNTSKFQKDTVELPTKISCQKITTESELHIAVKNGVDCRFSLSSVVENGLMTGYIYILTGNGETTLYRRKFPKTHTNNDTKYSKIIKSIIEKTNHNQKVFVETTDESFFNFINNILFIKLSTTVAKEINIILEKLQNYKEFKVALLKPELADATRLKKLKDYLKLFILEMGTISTTETKRTL